MEWDKIEEIYPQETEDNSWICIGNYQPMLESIARYFNSKIIEQYSHGQWEGDTWLLLQSKDNQFGYLQFGWGSCSGCDRLQGSNSIPELEELRESLANSIQWKNKQDMLKFMKEHDWEGDYANPIQFVQNCIKILEQ